MPFQAVSRREGRGRANLINPASVRRRVTGWGGREERNGPSLLTVRLAKSWLGFIKKSSAWSPGSQLFWSFFEGGRTIRRNDQPWFHETVPAPPREREAPFRQSDPLALPRMNSLVPKPVRAEEEEEEEEKPLTDPGGLSSSPSVRTRKTDDGATVFDKGGGHFEGV